jgi:hypothetical protein
MRPGPSEEFLEQLRRYAVRLAQPVFFGESPRNTYAAALENGSGCFVLLGKRLLGVTCYHVLHGFRQKRRLVPSVFQFGPIRLDPEQYLLSESPALDLATLDLTDYLDVVGNRVPRSLCIEPRRWPPDEIERDEVLTLAGFPGIWRSQMDLDHVRFYSFSHGATGVHAVGETHLVTRIEIDECIADFNSGLVLGSLGGLSGGPVFVWRKTPILIAELVGFIMEYQETLDLLYIRKAACVSAAGHVVP